MDSSSAKAGNLSARAPQDARDAPAHEPSGSPLPDTKSRAHLIGFGICVAVLIAAFIRPLIGLAVYAAHSNLNSHILLVPFVTAYLLHIRRDPLSTRFKSSPLWAIAPLIVALLSLSAAFVWDTELSRNDHFTLLALSFLGFLVAAGFLFLGRAWMWSAAFSVFFLIFMIPMPDAMANALETASKFASADAASFFFNLTGTPVLRDGLVFQLPNIAIQVAQECSGIRSSWVLFITSLLAANLFLQSPWRRAALVVFVIPLGIIRNGFRVFVIGTLCIRYGPQMIHSIIHRRGGPFFFALSLIPLFLLLWWLRRGDDGARMKAEDR